MKVLADQDWISFRPNVFALQDLAAKWIEIIKARLAEAQRADTVTEHIHQASNGQASVWQKPRLHGRYGWPNAVRADDIQGFMRQSILIPGIQHPVRKTGLDAGAL